MSDFNKMSHIYNLKWGKKKLKWGKLRKIKWSKDGPPKEE